MGFFSSTKITKLLQKHIEYPNQNTINKLRYYLQTISVNDKNKDKQTPLIIACQHGRTDYMEIIIKMLLKAGADINIEDKLGNTALMYSSQYSNTTSTENTVKILLQAGANVNFQNIYGITALMYASWYSNTTSTENTVKTLLDAMAKVNIQDNGFHTALMIASCYSNTTSTENTVKMLIEAGADVNLKNKHWITALIFASVSSNESSTENTVKMLLDAGANPYFKDIYGKTALMIASTENTRKILIDAGANIAVQNKNQYHFRNIEVIITSQYGNTMSFRNSVNRLLEAGAINHIQNGIKDEQKIEDEKTKDESLQCKVCYGNKMNTSLIPCGHIFCRSCIDSLPINNCPMCNKKIEKTMHSFL